MKEKTDWNFKDFGFDTRAIHAGQEPDPTTGAIMTPIYMTSTYVQDSPGRHKGYEYGRSQNLTRKAYEDAVANLENGKFGLAFGSGCATAATIIHLLKAGDHVICSDDVYGGTFRLFDKVIRHHGVEFSYVDLAQPENFSVAIKANTKIVWIETPTNPLLKLIDLKKISSIAKSKGIMTVVDNTFMSPFFQRPLDFGIDIVYHSTTKFINGHSDVIGGALVTNREDLNERLYFLQKSIGAVPSPFDCYLAMRGLKTLGLRMRAHEVNARRVASYLEKHPKVDRVVYPGLSSHPQYALACEQMTGFGGMITFFIKGGLSAARGFLEHVRVFALAESLGGVESLVDHPAIMTHASVPAENRKALGIDDSLIRLSVGIENIEDLERDLHGAFEHA